MRIKVGKLSDNLVGVGFCSSFYTNCLWLMWKLPKRKWIWWCKDLSRVWRSLIEIRLQHIITEFMLWIMATLTSMRLVKHSSCDQGACQLAHLLFHKLWDHAIQIPLCVFLVCTEIMFVLLVIGCCVLVALDSKNAQQCGSQESLPIFQWLFHRPFYFYSADGWSHRRREGFATHYAISGNMLLTSNSIYKTIINWRKNCILVVKHLRSRKFFGKIGYSDHTE